MKLTPIDSGFYLVSDADAGRLAKASPHGELPRHGYQIEVNLPDGRQAILQRTPNRYGAHAVKRGWSWAVFRIGQGFPKLPKRNPTMTTDTKLEAYRRHLADAQHRVRVARRSEPSRVKAHMADVRGWQRVIARHLRGTKRNPAMTRLMPHGRHEKVETKIRRKSSTGEYVVSLYIDNVKQREADYFTTDRADAQATARLMMERGVKSNPRGIPRAGSRLPQAARGPWGAPVKVWRKDGFTLRLYDTNVPTGTGRLAETYLAYEFFDGAKRIFTGDRYRVAPGYAIDSMAAVYGLLGFLSLKPGDTDDEYFKDYSPAQMAWVESGRAEDLSLLVMLNEERAGRREYRRRIGR